MSDSADNKNKERLQIEKIRLGDHEAFKKLFFDYYPKLIWFVNRYVKSNDIADDLVKELFIELWNRQERVVIHSSLNAYLYASVRNRALNYLKSADARWNQSKIQNIEDEELVLVDTRGENPSKILETKELESAIKEAVESLPGRCKLVFTLHRDDGLTYSEIAQVMEISPKTVENQMTRALRLLRSKLVPFLPFFLLAANSFRDVS